MPPICAQCNKPADVFDKSDSTVETVWICSQGHGVVKKQTPMCPKCGGPTAMDKYDIFSTDRCCKCTYCGHVLTSIAVRHSERAKELVQFIKSDGKTQGQKTALEKASIPCMHGDGCWTANCPYSHSFTKKNTPCKYGDGYRTNNCPYDHSSTKKKDQATHSVAKKSIPCKYGTGCRTHSCPYKHGL